MIYGHTSKEFSTTTNGCDDFVFVRGEELKNSVHEQTLKKNCFQQPVMLADVNNLRSKLLSIREIVGNLRKSLIGGEPMEDTIEGCVDNVAYGISSCNCIADEIRACLIDLYGRTGDYGDKW